MRTSLALLLLLLAAAVFCLAQDVGPNPDENQPSPQAPPPPFTPLAEKQKFHGLVLQIHNASMPEEYTKAIAEVADLGADTIMLNVLAFQVNGQSSRISRDPPRTPDARGLVDLVKFARARGLRVVLMPVVLLSEPVDNEWRGKITPADPDEWWADYQDYIQFVAQAADDGGAEAMMVGSELNRLESATDR